MTRGGKIGIGAAALLVAAIAAAVVAPGDPLEVDVVEVRRGPVEERVSAASSGDLEPHARATLRAETVGRLVEVAVKPGERVEAGETLVRFEAAPLAAAAAAARIQKEAAERDYATAARLAGQGIVTEQALDQARSLRDVARANHAAAEANLARTRITAPFAGMVTRLPVQEGDSVVVGQSVGEMVDDTALFVRAAFDEVDAVRIRVGDPALVRLDAYPDHPLPATVERVDPVVGGDSIEGSGLGAGGASFPIAGRKDRTVGIRVALGPQPPLPDAARLLVGMSADVEVVLSKKSDVLRVPSAAVFHEEGQRHVWKLEGGRLRKQPVTVGIGNWEWQEAVTGLAAGDRVVTTLDTAGLEDGAPASAREPDGEGEGDASITRPERAEAARRAPAP